MSEREESSKNIGSRLARRIERVAGKPSNWLDTDHSRNVARETASDYGSARIVPLLVWEELSGWLHDAVKRNRSQGETVPCPVFCSPDTFALRVSGASMEPRFRANDIIYCDPAVVPKSGSFVIVERAQPDEIVFRQLIIEGRRKYLKAINPQWPEPIEPVTGDDVFLGTVVFRGEEV